MPDVEIGGRMSLQLQMEQMPDYLAARFTGAGAPEEVWLQFELIAGQCKRMKNDKLLIDTSEAEGTISLLERYLMAKKTLIFEQYGLKVAYVDKPGRMDPKKFGELVARKLWINARMFSDFRAAEEWLLK